MQKKYLYTTELYDLYKVTAFVLKHNINKKPELKELDIQLLDELNIYLHEESYYNIIYIEYFIENGNIVHLLKKIIPPNIKIYLDNYLKLCNNDPKEFKHHLKIEEPFGIDDAYDLYLYYASRKNTRKHKSKTLTK